MSQETGCEFCNKRGLPILPLRYAPANAGCGAPHAEPGVDIPMPAAAGQYTRRLLREGYLYVYDEASGQWDDYLVTENGYFFRLPPGTKQTLAMPKEFNCAIEKHRAMASFITIYNSKQARNIWLAFSDARWTDAVRARHEQASYRKLHMRCVNIHAYDSSPDSRHCFAINHVGTHVAEYAQNEKALEASIGFSLFGLDKRQNHIKNLLAACEQMAPGKSFAIVLDDPVGMAADLARLSVTLLEKFNKEKDRPRAISAYGTISQLEMSTKQLAIQAGSQSLDERKAIESQPPWLHQMEKKDRQKLKNHIESLEISNKEFNRIENRAWAPYSAKINTPEMQAWRGKYENELMNFDQQKISPLAKIHVKWMESGPMQNYFACNYDRNDPASGLIYTQAITLCIAGTQDRVTCAELYSKWLADDIDTNILTNALTFNMDPIANTIKKTTSDPKINWHSLPMGTLIEAFQDATKKINTQKTQTLSPLITAISGVLAQAAQKISTKVNPALLALSMASKRIPVLLNVTGSKRAFRTILIKQLINETSQRSEIPISKKQIETAITAQLRRLEAAGYPLEKIERKQFLIMIDPASIPKERNIKSPAQWIANRTKTPEQLETIIFNQWNEKIKSKFIDIKNSRPSIHKFLGFILQYATVAELTKEQEKAMSHETMEILFRLNANVMILIASTTELIEKFLTGVLKTVKQSDSKILSYLIPIAKDIGGTGWLVLLLLDAHSAYTAINKRQYGMALLYMGNATLTVVIFHLLKTNDPFITKVAAFTLIGIALLIEFWKDTKIQEWLERCLWGNNKQERYKNQSEEEAQLTLART